MGPKLLDDGDLIMLAMELEQCSSVYIPRSGGVKASGLKKDLGGLKLFCVEVGANSILILGGTIC